MVKWVKCAKVVLFEVVMSKLLFLAGLLTMMLLLLSGGNRVATEAQETDADDDEEEEESEGGRRVVGSLFAKVDVVPGVAIATALEVGATLRSLPLSVLVS